MDIIREGNSLFGSANDGIIFVAQPALRVPRLAVASLLVLMMLASCFPLQVQKPKIMVKLLGPPLKPDPV